MKLTKVQELLNARVHAGHDILNHEVASACGSDLMSDVLAFVKDHALLLTGLLNLQVIRTAEMMDITAIVFVRGKTPPDDIINFAKEKDMVIMSTDLPMYLACGTLYSNGLGGRKAGNTLG
ncbi:MAG: hypothetical protein RSB38_06350 [Oscillospiraceae bacterium]